MDAVEEKECAVPRCFLVWPVSISEVWGSRVFGSGEVEALGGDGQRRQWVLVQSGCSLVQSGNGAANEGWGREARQTGWSAATFCHLLPPRPEILKITVLEALMLEALMLAACCLLIADLGREGLEEQAAPALCVAIASS